jgi:hypothetical protein
VAVAVHVRQVGAVAVLVDAVVGDLVGAREGRRRVVVAVGAGQEAIAVGVDLVVSRGSRAVLVEPVAQLVGQAGHGGVVGGAVALALRLSVAVEVLLVARQVARAVVVDAVAELRVPRVKRGVRIVAVPGAEPDAVPVEVGAVRLRRAVAVGVVAVGAAAQRVVVEDPVAVEVALQGHVVAVLVHVVVGHLGRVGVHVCVAVVAVGAATRGRRVAVAVRVSAVDAVAVGVEPVTPRVFLVGVDVRIGRCAVLRVLGAVAVGVEALLADGTARQQQSNNCDQK